jgi:hypothetical protein
MVEDMEVEDMVVEMEVMEVEDMIGRNRSNSDMINIIFFSMCFY